MDFKKDFIKAKIPVIPMKGRMTPHDRLEFKHFVIAVASEVNLNDLLQFTEKVLAAVGATVDVDPRIREHALTCTDRREKGDYLIRYKDSEDYCNFFVDVTIERLFRKRKPATMRLIEVLLRLNYYIVIHRRLPDEKLNWIVCPETVVDGKVVVVRLNDTPVRVNHAVLSTELPKVSDFSDLGGHRYSMSPVSLNIYLKDVGEDSTFKYNEKPLEVLVR
ncbi:MAG: hypothetical protein WCJ59_00575 [bacterium]